MSSENFIFENASISTQTMWGTLLIVNLKDDILSITHYKLPVFIHIILNAMVIFVAFLLVNLIDIMISFGLLISFLLFFSFIILPLFTTKPIFPFTHFFKTYYKKIAQVDQIIYDQSKPEIRISHKSPFKQNPVVEIASFQEKIIAIGFERDYVFTKHAYELNEHAFHIARLVFLTENGQYIPIGGKFGHFFLVNPSQKHDFIAIHNLIAYYGGFQIIDRYLQQRKYIYLFQNPQILLCACEEKYFQNMSLIKRKSEIFIPHIVTANFFAIHLFIWLGLFIIDIVIISLTLNTTNWLLKGIQIFYNGMILSLLAIYVMLTISLLKSKILIKKRINSDMFNFSTQM